MQLRIIVRWVLCSWILSILVSVSLSSLALPWYAFFLPPVSLRQGQTRWLSHVSLWCSSQLFQTLWGMLRKRKFCLTGNRSDHETDLKTRVHGDANKTSLESDVCLRTSVENLRSGVHTYCSKFSTFPPYRLEWCLPTTLAKAGCLQVSSCLE